jgi:hypothetical protein
MAIKIQELGAIGYGGVVTLSKWWDDRRIDQGKIGAKDILKKASFYTYLGVGLVATLMSVFGWMRKYEAWSEKISTGFFYGLPGFVYDLSKTLSASRGSRSSESRAVQEAQKILERQSAARQLPAGQYANRSYQPEFAVKSFTW